MLTNIRYILLTAIRDRLFVGLFVAVIFAAYLSRIMGSTAMLEPEMMQLSFTAAAVRVILVVGLVVFACFHVRHAFDSREIDVLLSRPISRTNLVVSYWLGFSLVSLVLVCAGALVVYLTGIFSNYGYWAWFASLLLETWLVVALSLFAAFTLKSAVTSVLATFGFYTLARMMGFFIATTEQTHSLFGNAQLNMVMNGAIQFISVVIPRLDFFAKTRWLIYSLKDAHEVQLFLLQAAIYIPLLVVAAIVDFKRKQF